MKPYLIMYFSLTLIFTSCETNKNKLSVLTSLKGENELSYNESLHKWTDLKRVNGSSYIYQTTFLSWAGFGSTTELKIVDGKVTARVYEGFSTDEQTGERTITDSYEEGEETLGSHEKGASPLTIDELYKSCASDYLIVDIENNTLYFETEINGLMTLCGFVPNGCADDCYQGISIDSFDWID
ncbi:MAG: hypothetical protein HRU26_11250 [Psychroserpens sp.]|nr:hypothetical protein [Psychroserpens sp.]